MVYCINSRVIFSFITLFFLLLKFFTVNKLGLHLDFDFDFDLWVGLTLIYILIWVRLFDFGFVLGRFDFNFVWV